MSTKLSRRRFLTDVACLGTVLLGAAWLAPRPFFERFLEDQNSDHDGHNNVTCAYPSDSDSDVLPKSSAAKSRTTIGEEIHSLQPFFARFLS